MSFNIPGCGYEVAKWYCVSKDIQASILWVTVYFLGMAYSRRYCCGCDDHAGSDLLTMIFWPIAIPYYHIKELFK